MDETPSGPNRAVVIGIAVAVTAVTLTAAIYLGAWGFEFRRRSMHESRMQRLLQKHPAMDQVLKAFQTEGTLLFAAAESHHDLARIALRFRDQKRAEILEKGNRWPSVRVFLANDMVYFVFFDREQVMRAFTCVSRR